MWLKKLNTRVFHSGFEDFKISVATARLLIRTLRQLIKLVICFAIFTLYFAFPGVSWATKMNLFLKLGGNLIRTTNVSNYFRTTTSNKIKQVCILQVRNAFPSNEKNKKGHIQLRNSPNLKSPANQRNSLTVLSSHTQALILFHLWNFQSCLPSLFSAACLDIQIQFSDNHVSRIPWLAVFTGTKLLS